MASLNFYRQIEGLPTVHYEFNTNQQAQTAAADMAAANNFQHGLKGIERPGVVSCQGQFKNVGFRQKEM
ncbi:hypothetical protein [Furfurilactobacillus cerevisiae]|uniref:hypothetical protein n=1 Tax=Furfurilactobacillus rossiae TaxID=231049 RepID=UPI003B987003